MKKIFKLDDAKKNLRRAALIAIGAFSLSATQMQAQDGSKLFNKIYEKLEKVDHKVNKITQPGRDLASKIRIRKGEIESAKFMLGQALPMEINQRINRVTNAAERVGDAVQTVRTVTGAGRQRETLQEQHEQSSQNRVRYVQRAPRGGRE
ncbi:MAG: hypothetical protein J6L86_06420 [Alphaproteobacteria bacterium]|nr:hypothetical protein [Alphaproteobacteria bacterium]